MGAKAAGGDGKGFVVGGGVVFEGEGRVGHEKTLSDDELPIREALEHESTPTPAPVFEEKPTITYVLRGQKATFHNPQYHPAPEVLEASKLPIDHPDFEVAASSSLSIIQCCFCQTPQE
ncbi:uncharacterized protein F5147DRAFT_660557 [Suillus discolor]|uniref:Uncharacterized protein n=1 Tax=Suillus discolor TaxID=1912936 RepID=A0A9P7JKV8_9AGAM|nr:uncharacterized protein F5147DRAFT_660557 [Suillus discolor]KAG2082172.1 hypothetical protein F5147DRAFT_660557 [Suillus discolor]